MTWQCMGDDVAVYVGGKHLSIGIGHVMVGGWRSQWGEAWWGGGCVEKPVGGGVGRAGKQRHKVEKWKSGKVHKYISA
jgi:hypothetical protein